MTEVTGSTEQSQAASSATVVDGAFKWPADRPLAPAPLPSRAVVARPKRIENAVQGAALVLGLGIALWIYVAPLPAGLSAPGKTGLAALVLCTTLWITHVIPFGATGLLAVALLGLTRAMTPADAFAAFGSSAVFFLIGIFIIAASLIHSGLSKRCALWFLSKFGRSPYAFVNGMMLAAAFGTVWMPNQATTAMLFPIAMEVALALRLRTRRKTI